MKPIISTHNVGKIFRDSAGRRTVALRDIDLNVYPGEFLVIMGPSGSGKSTLLRIMSGLEKEYDGICDVEKDVRNSMGFVFQQFGLLPWLTVEENIAFGLTSRGDAKSETTKQARKELKRFGLQKFSHSYPRELSGGMKQRVGIARAFAINPQIIFLDEPFSELDSFIAESLRRELLDVWKERKVSVVMVTHLVQEAVELADRIAVLTQRPGVIEKIIKNTLERPRATRSQGFFALEDKLYNLLKP